MIYSKRLDSTFSMRVDYPVFMQFSALLKWSLVSIVLLSIFLMSGASGTANLNPKLETTSTNWAGSPLLFVENTGQFEPGVHFKIQTRGGIVWLANDGLWFTRQDEKSGDGINVHAAFEGANPSVRIEPFKRLETKVSYFTGSNPEKWQADVPVWGGVRYIDLYPGVDLEVSGLGGELDLRAVAQPGFDLSTVALRMEGAESIILDGDYLRVTTNIGEFGLPLLQLDTLNQSTKLVPGIDGSVVKSPFATSAANSLLLLPLDNPDDLVWSTFLGGNGLDTGQSIAVGTGGDIYVVGATKSTNFPSTPGVYQESGGSGYYSDAYVAKLNPDGTGLEFATYLGGIVNGDGCGDIAIDEDGFIYLTGETYSTDFPVTPGAYRTNHSSSSRSQAYVTKMSADGTGLIYSTFLGNDAGNNSGGKLLVDAAGNVYATGSTSGGFPITPGAYDSSYNGSYTDAYIVKLNADGSDALLSTYLGGSGDDYPSAGIALDGAGNIYVSGLTRSANFPTTPGSFDDSYGGGTDAFLVKMNATGTALDYSAFLGGSGYDHSGSLAMDDDANIYLTGQGSAGFPTTPDAYDTSLNGGRDTFALKMNLTNPDPLIYSTFLGGNGTDVGVGIAIDGSGKAYVTGYTASSNFPTTPGSMDTSYNGGSLDAFMSILNDAGSELVYSTFLGGSATDEGGLSIALDDAGDIFVSGRTFSSDYPTTIGAFDTTLNGGEDAFVTKLAIGSLCTPTPQRVLFDDFSDGEIDNNPTWTVAKPNYTVTNEELHSNGQHTDGSGRYSSSFRVDDTFESSNYLEWSYRGLLKAVGSPQPGVGTIVALFGPDGGYELNIQKGYTNGFPTNKYSISLTYAPPGYRYDLIVSSFAPQYDQFYEVRGVRKGGVFTLYVDGIEVGSASDPLNMDQFHVLRMSTVGSVVIDDVEVNIESCNRTPVVASNETQVTFNEGQTAINSGTIIDEDGDVVTLNASIGAVVNNNDGTWSWSLDTNDGPNESQVVTISADDGNGGLGESSFQLTVNNVAPSIAASGQPSVNEGALYTLDLGAVTDPGDDTVTSYIVHWGDGQTGSYASGGDVTHTYADGSSSAAITVDLVDEDGTYLNAGGLNVTVNNVAPSITLTGLPSVKEGSLYTLNLGAITDPGQDTLSEYIVHWGDGASDSYLAGGDVTYVYTDGPLLTTISVDLEDEDGLHLSAGSLGVTVINVAPSVETITLPLDPVKIEDQASFTVAVTFSDPAGTYDEPYTCDFDLDYDGETFSADSSITGVMGTSCSTPLNYSEPGVYTIKVMVSDKDVGSGMAEADTVMVIYDPEGGFVTGGGWIYSEAGWCELDDICAGAAGKANFGFVSKYKKGTSVPTGNTEFNFKTGGLNFHSSDYDWLVVNQNGTNAQYKGMGTIKGDEAAFKFMLWAKDLDSDVDTFRIKIWYENEDGSDVVVYDNGFDQAIGGGNIVVHTGKK